MSNTNVGANLMFARRTKTGIKPMFESEFETFASAIIGSQTIVVRRANTRFAPTLVSDIGWISISTIYPKTYDRLLIHLTGVGWVWERGLMIKRKKALNVWIVIMVPIVFWS